MLYSYRKQDAMHMITNRLLEPLQAAHTQCHSCETALLKAQNDMLMAMDKQQVTILPLLDLSAAFDTVNYNLCQKDVVFKVTPVNGLSLTCQRGSR